MYSAMIFSVVSERLMLMRSLRRDMVDTVKRVESGNSQIIKRRGEVSGRERKAWWGLLRRGDFPSQCHLIKFSNKQGG